MTQQDELQQLVPRPMTDNSQAWERYWQVAGQPWRRKPEISADRQRQLTYRRWLPVRVETGEYPFHDLASPLSRADLEWLLATHESDGLLGPVDVNDEAQTRRVGLDLRGADLSGASLARLPLARTVGGLGDDQWTTATPEQRAAAAMRVHGANLQSVQLIGACLRGACLEYVNLTDALLDHADLREAHLKEVAASGASLRFASLENAELGHVILECAQMEGARLSHCDLSHLTLLGTNLKAVQLTDAQFECARRKGARLDGVDWPRFEIEW